MVGGSISAQNLNLVSTNITVTGSNGTPFSFGFQAAFSLFSGGGVDFSSPQGSLDLMTSNGVFTGASLNLSDSFYHSPFDQFVIGLGGDSFAYQVGATNGSCENYVNIGPSGGGIYNGPTMAR